MPNSSAGHLKVITTTTIVIKKAVRHPYHWLHLNGEHTTVLKQDHNFQNSATVRVPGALGL